MLTPITRRSPKARTALILTLGKEAGAYQYSIYSPDSDLGAVVLQDSETGEMVAFSPDRAYFDDVDTFTGTNGTRYQWNYHTEQLEAAQV